MEELVTRFFQSLKVTAGNLSESMHKSNILSFGSLGNADPLGNAASQALPAVVPAIISGSALDRADVTRSRKELQSRKRTRNATTSLPVTDLEVTDAEIRHLEVIAEHVVQDAPMAGITAVMSNVRAFNINKASYNRVVALSDGSCLVIPIVKTTPGVGAGWPGLPLPQVLPPPVPLYTAAVPFPADMDACKALSEQQIRSLGYLYNDDFRITAQDNLQKKREKFISFIIGF